MNRHRIIEESHNYEAHQANPNPVKLGTGRELSKIVGLALSMAATGLLLLLAAGCANKLASKPPAPPPSADADITIGQQYILHSSILNEDRPYLVYLPESYTNRVYLPKSYPVLYLLDGDWNFQYASGVVQFLGEFNQVSAIPELIIVAIPNTDRLRDMTPTHSLRGFNGTNDPSLASSGGADQFLKFLRDELIPHIEAEYRTMPYRILAGHSLTGLFAMSALLHQPPVFQGFIATDPSIWWDDRILLRQAEEAFARTNALRGAAFVSIAGVKVQRDWDDSLQRNAPRDFAALLQAHNSATFRSGSRTFDDENHVSAGLLSLYYGLEFLFDGYRVSFNEIKHPDLIPGHFAAVSQKVGVQLLPDEKFVDNYAISTLYNVHETNEALEWFKINTSNYPDSFNAWNGLGLVYDAKGDKQLAIDSFEKAVALNPDDRYAAERLRRLKTPVSPSGPLTNGIYVVINSLTGKALEVAGGSPTNQAAITEGKYKDARHQQWAFKNLGDGYYQVTAAHSGKAMDVNGESIDNGATLFQWPYHDGANQVWQVIPNGDGTYRLLNEHSRLALEVADSSRQNGAVVDQSAWNFEKRQKWRVKSVLSKR